MTNLVLLSTSYRVPETVLDNSFFGNIPELNTTEQWILERTGIRERRRARNHEEFLGLVKEAVDESLDAARLDPQDLEGIIVSTVTHQRESTFPSLACRLQREITSEILRYCVDLSFNEAGEDIAAELGKNLALSGNYLVTNETRFQELMRLSPEERKKISVKDLGLIVGHKGGSLEGVLLTRTRKDDDCETLADFIRDYLGAKSVKYCFDISAACAGFPISLAFASKLNKGGYWLIVAAENLTRITDYTDRNNCFLFGDGIGVAVLGNSFGDSIAEGIVASYGSSDPFNGKADAIWKDEKGFLRMPNGRMVFNDAVRSMKMAFDYIISRTGWRKEEIILNPHPANGRITSALSQRLCNVRCVLDYIDIYGNPSTAGTAIALAKGIEEGKITRESDIAIVAFGSGFVTGAVGIRY